MRSTNRRFRSRSCRVWFGGWAISYRVDLLPADGEGAPVQRWTTVRGRLGTVNFGFSRVVGVGARSQGLPRGIDAGTDPAIADG